MAKLGYGEGNTSSKMSCRTLGYSTRRTEGRVPRRRRRDSLVVDFKEEEEEEEEEALEVVGVEEYKEDQEGGGGIPPLWDFWVYSRR